MDKSIRDAAYNMGRIVADLQRRSGKLTDAERDAMTAELSFAFFAGMTGIGGLAYDLNEARTQLANILLGKTN